MVLTQGVDLVESVQLDSHRPSRPVLHHMNMKQATRFQFTTLLVLLCIGTVISGISKTDYLASEFRPPAVPLIVFDGYNNVWSMADNLYDDWPR